jgi:stage IV sporulation protein FB
VFLLEPERTQFDLNFRLFGIPVRVHPLFWLVTALLGSQGALDREGLLLLVVWIACVFVSILIHELGHVLVGMLFGSRGHIILYSFGGLAVGSSDLRNRWQRIAVYFAGPFAQLLLLIPIGLVVAFTWGREDVGPFGQAALWNLVYINLFWPVLNLLPIWPLDGGRISYDFLGWLFPRSGNRAALGISMVVAGCIAALFAFGRIWFSAIFFAVLAVGSWQAMQAEYQPREYDDDSWRYGR